MSSLAEILVGYRTSFTLVVISEELNGVSVSRDKRLECILVRNDRRPLSSDIDLRTDLDDAAGRDVEVIRRRCAVAREQDK